MGASEKGTGAAAGCGAGIVTGLILFFLYGFWTRTPAFNLQHFNVSGLNTTTTTTTTTTVQLYFVLEIKNRNAKTPVYYDVLNITFYYAPPVATAPGTRRDRSSTTGAVVEIGGAAYPAFKQGNGKTKDVTGNANASGTVDQWKKKAAAAEGNGGGLAVFRVGVATKVRYTRMYAWKTRRYPVDVSADVEVGADGGGRIKKGLKLTRRASGAWRTGCNGAVRRVVVVLVLFGSAALLV